MLDVSSSTVGVEGLNGEMIPVIPRNSFIPVKKSAVFTASTQEQFFPIKVTASAFTLLNAVKIYQGERPLVKDCIFITECTLDLGAPRR